jgi:hypothetical protein
MEAAVKLAGKCEKCKRPYEENSGVGWFQFRLRDADVTKLLCSRCYDEAEAKGTNPLLLLSRGRGNSLTTPR